MQKREQCKAPREAKWYPHASRIWFWQALQDPPGSVMKHGLPKYRDTSFWPWRTGHRICSMSRFMYWPKCKWRPLNEHEQLDVVDLKHSLETLTLMLLGKYPWQRRKVVSIEVRLGKRWFLSKCVYKAWWLWLLNSYTAFYYSTNECHYSLNANCLLSEEHLLQ
jgi:hypothetical protein